MNETSPVAAWSPDYPDKRDKRVGLSDLHFR